MTPDLPAQPEPAEIFLYQTEDGQSRLEVSFSGETCWLSLTQMAELFQRDKSVISRHIKNVFEEGELVPDSVVANFATTAADGKTYRVDYYNLDVIISVGYCVKSHRGTQFRIWATKLLREFIIKGFALDDDRLKQAGGGNYFEELVAGNIRSSEKVFWRKVLDIYATSIDYDPRACISVIFRNSTEQNALGCPRTNCGGNRIPTRRLGKRKHGSHQLDRQHNHQKRSRHRQELPELRRA